MHRTAPSVLALSGALCLSFLLVACGAPASAPGTGAAGSPTPTATSTASASPTSTSTLTATASATETASTPSEGWATYTTTDGDLTFDYPSTWTIKDPAGETPASGGVFLEITNPNGKPLATLRTHMAVGSTCTDRQPYAMLDSEPVPALAQSGETPRFIFESRMDATQTDPMKMDVLAYGITSGPEPTGPDACPIFQFFTWPPNAAMFSGVYNPFDTTPGNEPHVDTPHAYMETQEYKDIKKMITSLRPAS
ncbi:hypothetical protein M1D88_04615 [Arthrobacter sp. R1-13]